jgi:hypothetical protein
LVIVCPFAGEVHPRTHQSLKNYGAIFNDVGHHPAAYPELLRKLWDRGEDTIIVEHDIVVPPGAIATFYLCPKPWCWHSYVGAAPWTWPPLGLVRITGAAMAQTPDCWERYLTRTSQGLNPDTQRPMLETGGKAEDESLPPLLPDPLWTHCDEWLAAYLRRAEICDHRHYPDVENL